MILALDMATRTGWALWDGHQVVSGARDFKPKPSHAARLWGFRAWLCSVLTGVERVVYETPFLHAKHRSGCLVGSGMEAVLLVEAHDRGLDVRGVAPSSLKKWATGKGNAKKVDMAVAAMDRWPGFVPGDDNEVDARWLLAMALEA